MNINKWIRVDYTFGSNVALLERREITEIGSRAAAGLGRLIVDDYRKQELESNLLFTFTPRVNDDFTLKVIVGNSVNQRTITNNTQTGSTVYYKGYSQAEQYFTATIYN